MTDNKNIAFAKLNLDFDEKEFANEFDTCIMPHTRPFGLVHTTWTLMPELNKHWHLISDDKFDHYNNIFNAGGTVFDNTTHHWRATNLMKNEQLSEWSTGTGFRSLSRHTTTTLKDQFKNLQITKWINDNIPAKRIIGIHCVSIDPGGFGSMHRDLHWTGPSPNPAANNGFFKEGFVVVCLNISNGGVPLLWAMDHEKLTPKAIDAKCYIGNDYFIHGVPETLSRRRQIRISFEPAQEFYQLIESDTMLTVPDDYNYH